ncbi:hypothetical protein [Labilibaculum filiforme]|jgi:hypothetical protein|uniref:hypothetical protein n=1 Tax=Labilibaculum filiforme TaxID=1940526 RepID=UPI0015D6293F|nr:hypothetical protein [Labilibaculum filiforme]
MNTSLKKVKIMKTKKDSKAMEVLNRNKLGQVKGGEDRDYYTVIIDGKEVRIYV